MSQQLGGAQPLQLVVEPGSALYDHLMRYFAEKSEVADTLAQVLGEFNLIDELGLPTRVRNALVRNGIMTIGTLLAQTPESLLEIRGVSVGSVNTTIETLDKFGLKLAGKRVQVVDHRMLLRDLRIREDILEGLAVANIYTVGQLLAAQDQWTSIRPGGWKGVVDILKKYHIRWRY